MAAVCLELRLCTSAEINATCSQAARCRRLVEAAQGHSYPYLYDVAADELVRDQNHFENAKRSGDGVFSWSQLSAVAPCGIIQEQT